MGPGISRSLKHGFGAASRSWAGIGVFAVVWIAVIGVAIASVALTHPPRQLAQEGSMPTARTLLPAAPAAASSSQATAKENAPATSVTPPANGSPAAASEKPTLFKDLSTATATELQAPAATPPIASGSPVADKMLQATRETRDRETREIQAWIGRSWPVLLITLVCLMVMNLLLTGGQIGYLTEQVARQSAKVSTFWIAGAAAFRSLLLASLLWLLGMGGLFLVGAVLVIAFSALTGKLPDWVLLVPGLLALIGAVGAVIWLGVRLSVWFIAIVADRIGPIAGLKASFRATRGRWWKAAGLGVVVALISYAVWLVMALVEWIGNAIGGPVALSLGLIGNLAGMAASVYIGFAGLAAFIQFYLDAKGGSASEMPSSP